MECGYHPGIHYLLFTECNNLDEELLVTKTVRDLKETREFGKDHFRKDHLRKDPCTINQSHPAVIDQSHPAVIDQSHPATEDAPGIDPQPGL